MGNTFVYSSYSFAADEQGYLPHGDVIAPQIIHEPISGDVVAGESTEINATVTDNSGVESVTIFYRQIGDAKFQQRLMQQLPGSDDYATTFEDALPPGFEYYIEAADFDDNVLSQGHFSSPLQVMVPGVIDSQQDTSDTTEITYDDSSSGSYKKWVWIGLGVLAVGALANKDDGGDDPEPPTVMNVDAPLPQN